MGELNIADPSSTPLGWIRQVTDVAATNIGLKWGRQFPHVEQRIPKYYSSSGRVVAEQEMHEAPLVTHQFPHVLSVCVCISTLQIKAKKRYRK
jgi:hypothetical protein